MLSLQRLYPYRKPRGAEVGQTYIHIRRNCTLWFWQCKNFANSQLLVKNKATGTPHEVYYIQPSLASDDSYFAHSLIKVLRWILWKRCFLPLPFWKYAIIVPQIPRALFRGNNDTVSYFKPTRIATMSAVFCHFNGNIALNFMFFSLHEAHKPLKIHIFLVILHQHSHHSVCRHNLEVYSIPRSTQWNFDTFTKDNRNW